MTVTLSTMNLIRPANAPRQSGLLAVAHHLLALWATRQQATAQHQRARQAALDAAQVRQDSRRRACIEPRLCRRPGRGRSACAARFAHAGLTARVAGAF
jgi:hypothetical protein